MGRAGGPGPRVTGPPAPGIATVNTAEARSAKPFLVKSIIDIAVADIVFREDLYPRLEHERSAATVESYVDQGIEVLPPIEINRKRELIDGWHRWMAHRKLEAPTIKAIVTSTSSDMEVLKEIANSGSSFLVAVRIDAVGRVRALNDIPVPRRYADLFTEIPEHRFRFDTSSSEIRARGRAVGNS